MLKLLVYKINLQIFVKDYKRNLEIFLGFWRNINEFKWINLFLFPLKERRFQER